MGMAENSLVKASLMAAIATWQGFLNAVLENFSDNRLSLEFPIVWSWPGVEMDEEVFWNYIEMRIAEFPGFAKGKVFTSTFITTDRAKKTITLSCID